MISPEVAAKIAIWRAHADAGTYSIEEMREAIKLMREGRMGAAVSSEQARRAKAKKEVKSAEELLKELGV